MAASLADRLPGIFVQYLPDQPICRLFINPVFHMMIDAPPRLALINDRSRQSIYLCVPLPDEQEQALPLPLRSQGIQLEAGKQGVLQLDISRFWAEQLGIIEGHHIAWADERERYIAFPYSIIEQSS